MAKKPVGVVPAQWDDDKIIAWAKAKHVTKVYPGDHVSVATVEQREVNDLPLGVIFEEMMRHTHAECKPILQILGRKVFGVDPSGIEILRNSALEDEEDEAELFFCRQDGCTKGPNAGPRFFDSEDARDGHEASAHRVKELAQV